MAVPNTAVLIINNDDAERHQLSLWLADGGFSAHEAATAAQARTAMAGNTLILLRDTLPDSTAEALCDEIRTILPECRVIGIGTAPWADQQLPDASHPAQLFMALGAAQAEKHGEPRSRAEALGTLAHDLRNTLAPLRSAIAIMVRAGQDEQTRKTALAMMEKQVVHMTRQLDALSSRGDSSETARPAVPGPEARIAPATDTNPILSTTAALSPTLRSEPPAAVSRRGRRVLVADDSSAIQESVGALLRSQGYEVRTASNGIEALELAQNWLPDFVFVDMRMPKLDGFGLARRLRAAYPSTPMKIILMSGITIDGVLLRHARAAGFDECIDKVCSPEQWFVHLQTD